MGECLGCEQTGDRERGDMGLQGGIEGVGGGHQGGPPAEGYGKAEYSHGTDYHLNNYSNLCRIPCPCPRCTVQ